MDFEDLANDVEIVFLRFFIDHAAGRKSPDDAVVSARRQFRVPTGKFHHRIHRDLEKLRSVSLG